MHLIPFIKYDIITTLTPSEVQTAISKNTHKEKVFSLNWPDSVFMGNVSQNSFKIMHVNKHIRNSFNPLIIGETESVQEGAIVHITMRLCRAVEAFSTFFLFSLLLMWVSAIASLDVLFILFALIFTAGFLGMTLGGFNYGVNKSKSALNIILKT